MHVGPCVSLSYHLSRLLHLTRLCVHSPVRRPARARRVIESSGSEGPEDEHVERDKTSAQILQPRPSIAKRPPALTTGPVIDLTISSDEDDGKGVVPTNAKRVSAKPARKVASRAPTTQYTFPSTSDENKFTIPLFADDPDDDEDEDPMNKDDGSILVLYVAPATKSLSL